MYQASVSSQCPLQEQSAIQKFADEANFIVAKRERKIYLWPSPTFCSGIEENLSSSIQFYVVLGQEAGF